MPRKIVTEYKLVSFDVCPFVQRSIISPSRFKPIAGSITDAVSI